MLAILYTYRRHKRKIRDYEQDINSLEDKSAKLYQQYHNVVAESMQIPEGLTDDDKAFLERLTNVINSTTEKGISDIESIATQMHISTLALRRRLSQTLSVTPKAYIMQVRMQKAKDLLQNYRDLTVAEVATKCGYTQVPNFTRAFKNFYGIMPTEMKNERMKK